MLRTSLNTNVGEQLPGSLEAIRKAVSKFYKKDISTSEMFQLMKDGKLLAKDILPLLGEEFSKMAKTGDALKFALSSLSTVQQRMNTSFREWINNVYKGGLAEGLSELYKTLDKMFFLMSQGDSGTGKFLKGFIDSARKSIIWVHDTLLDIYYLITEDLGLKGVDMELLGKVAYWTTILGLMNSIAGVMKLMFGGTVLNGITSLAGKMLGLKTAIEGVTIAQEAATVATVASTSSGWIGMLISQSKLLLAALTPVAAVVAAIASAAAILNLAQSKYNDFSAEQKADWQQKMTTMNASATQGYYTKSGLEQLGSQGNLPNTNPYAQMMQASADTNRQLQEIILNAPPLRVDVRVEESELSKFIKFRVDEGMQRQIQSIVPTGTPSLIVK